MSDIPANPARVWYALRFTLPAEAEEALAARLVELSDRGVDSTRRGVEAEVTAYCTDPAEAEALAADAQQWWAQFAPAAGLTGPLRLETEQLCEEDWAEAWKAYYHPLRVGRRLVIKPSWESWPPADDPSAAAPDDLVMELDPQMAFGTGTHGTTQLCLEALERHLRPGERVADVGCGSGILSLAAALLGAAEVEAWELDAMAAEVAQANLERSGVAERCRVRQGDALAGLEGRYDLLVANVHTQFLLQLLPRLPEHLRPGGRVVLSGATETSATALIEAVEAAGLRLRERCSRDEWIALVAETPQ